MVTLEQLQSKQEKVCVVGLGYVGLPLAVLLSKHFSVIGFDVNKTRIAELKQGIEVTKEVDSAELQQATIFYSDDPASIADAKFIIVAVPTPITDDKEPDLTILKKASQMVGEHMVEGSIVVYESTVYPGATEEICLPILEAAASLHAPEHCLIGYSPERVNPGDKEHTIDKVVKVVSGMNKESLAVIAGVYGTVTTVFEASSIKVAEAAKVIENTQRDLNIALMNELSLIFAHMNISVYDVLAAAGTKWNFLPFKPGLVGGHCIGVDPYYLTHKATQLGYSPDVILAGRGINDRIPTIIAETLMDQLRQLGKDPKDATVVMLGVTFKENIPDIRNSKVVDMYRAFIAAGMTVFVCDPHADVAEVAHEYGFSLTEKDALPKADLLVVGVAHDEFASLDPHTVQAFTNGHSCLLADIKHLYNRQDIEDVGLAYWSL